MGAISYAAGVCGSTYLHNEQEFTLSGWTLEALIAHERWIEKGATDAIQSMRITTEQRNAAIAAVVKSIACHEYGYGGAIWDASIKNCVGLGHFLWQLCKPAHPKLSFDECCTMAREDTERVWEAVQMANPQNRATADLPKSE